MTGETTLMRYHEIELYGDPGVHDNLAKHYGIDAYTAEFTPAVVAAERIGWHRREHHTHEDEARVIMLVESILEGRTIPRIVVVERDGYLSMPDGYHRCDAFLRLGVTEVEVLIVRPAEPAAREPA